jgi:hypothetical protein
MTSKTDGPGQGPAKPAAEGGAPKKPSAIIELKATAVEDKDAGAAKPGNEPKAPKAEEQGAPKPANTSSPTRQGARPAEAGKPAAAQSPPEPTDTKASNAKPTSKQADGDPPGDKGSIEEHAPKSNRRSGVFAPMAAGVVGGFLALLGAVALGPQLGLNGDLWVKHASELQRRLAAIEQAAADRAAAAANLGAKLAAAESRLARLADLSKPVNELTEAHAKLAGDLQALEQKLGRPEAASELGARLAKLEETLAALSAAAANDPQSGRIPQLAAITGKLSDLESTLNNQLAAQRNGIAQEIDARVAQIAAASEAARSGTQRIDRELAGVKEDAARLWQRTEAFKAAGDRFEQALQIAREEMAGLSSALEALKGGVAAQLKNVARAQDVSTAIAAIDSKVTALDENLQSVVKSEEDRRTHAERIVLALELGSLRRALDRGGAYAAELAEVEKIAGGKIDLAPLERYKNEGVPTAAELAREFRTVAHAVIDAEVQQADASVVDRLLLGASSIVRVRRTEHDADDKSAEAVLGRMEKALKEARLSDALAEAQQLSPKAQAAAKAWLGKLEARATVDRAIAQIEDQLKASLAGNAQMEKRIQ